VAYAVECRRRVKEQMNKRKPDDEFARINLSYFNADGRRSSSSARNHYTITYGDMGYSYESILGPYLEGAKAVVIEDPYIRLPHQITNFVRFCETLLKPGTVKQIKLVTGYDNETQLADIADKLEDLKQSLLELDVVLEVKLNPNLHDREIRIDNGWTVKIGRGLDFYQKPESWYGVGATDLSLRKCLETKVDIFAILRTRQLVSSVLYGRRRS
jgi:ATP-dependent Lon protease